MADPFVAEIRIFPFNFAPKGWAFCDGQLLALSQNTALFSLLGTTYGGDGKSNFALPNLQGDVPMHPSQGPGLSLHFLGEIGGIGAITLIESEMPAHNHTVGAQTNPLGALAVPGPTTTLSRPASGNLYFNNVNGGLSSVTMHPITIQATGSSFPHNNMQPYLTLNFCIALQGVYPPRT